MLDWIKSLFKQKVEARQKPEQEACPFCAFGSSTIYDQEHDCCLTCKSKWKVGEE